MWPFTKKRDFKQEFAEKVAKLPTLSLSAVVFADQYGLDRNRILTTKIFCGYLYGLGDCLEEQSEILPALVRGTAFRTIFGDEKGQFLFNRTVELLLEDDQQAKRGWGAGVPDGERLLLGPPSNLDEAASSLTAMFQIKMIKIDEQVE